MSSTCWNLIVGVLSSITPINTVTLLSSVSGPTLRQYFCIGNKLNKQCCVWRKRGKKWDFQTLGLNGKQWKHFDQDILYLTEIFLFFYFLSSHFINTCREGCLLWHAAVVFPVSESSLSHVYRAPPTGQMALQLMVASNLQDQIEGPWSQDKGRVMLSRLTPGQSQHSFMNVRNVSLPFPVRRHFLN